MSHSCDPSCPHLLETEIDYGTSLFQNIDLPSIACLNINNSTKPSHPFKPYGNRLLRNPYLESNDNELIVYIPFISMCNIKSIVVSSHEQEYSPTEISLYINREDVDFNNVSSIQALQKFNLSYDPLCSIEYYLKPFKFQNVSSLILYLTNNSSKNIINYIGIKGENMNLKRQAIVAVYESRANTSDHKVKGVNTNSSSIL